MGVSLGVTQVITDSSSAFDVIKNPGVMKRNLVLDRKISFCRDAWQTGLVKMFHCTTDKMMGDSLTKVVDKTKFLTCRAYQLGE